MVLFLKINNNTFGGFAMINYDKSIYSLMYGSIADSAINAVSCIGQCTGCKCSCKCSCRNRPEDSFEWEGL